MSLLFSSQRHASSHHELFEEKRDSNLFENTAPSTPSRPSWFLRKVLLRIGIVLKCPSRYPNRHASLLDQAHLEFNPTQ